MSNFNIVSLDYDPLSTVRASSQFGRSFLREKNKKLLENIGKRPGSLSPLHLTYKTLDDTEFNGLCIGLIKLQSRGSQIIQDPVEKFSQTTMEHKFLAKHYNFSEHKRLTNKLNFSQIKKIQRTGDRFSEKYEVISKDKRFAGRNPESIKLMKGVIPVTMAKFNKKLSENSVRLRVCGVIKSFSPRTSLNLFDNALYSFKK